MRKILALLAGLALVSLVSAAGKKLPWEFAYKPLKGGYVVYAGSLGEPIEPTHSERKISFVLTGSTAKEMFDSMGPDIPDTCGTEGGGRMRIKEHVTCDFYPGDRSYTCHMGFNLRTGKSIAGSIC